jgi:hypothetical protein
MKLVDLGVRLEDKMDETGKPIIKLGNRGFKTRALKR